VSGRGFGQQLGALHASTDLVSLVSIGRGIVLRPGFEKQLGGLRAINDSASLVYSGRVYARALRASQYLKRAEVWVGARCA
jgi:hypothetical protein